MILVDTSIWVDHFRRANDHLIGLLNGSTVLAHPWVIGELSLGGLNDEAASLLHRLPRAQVATDDEVMHLISTEALPGTGIGYVDAQLLAATRLTADASIWTNDTRLSRVADTLGVGANVG